MIKKQYRYLFLGVMIGVIFSIVMFSGFDSVTASEISFNIFQECGRDNDCVHKQMMELSETESKDVVLFVANNITYLWEKEQYNCHQVAHHMGMFLIKY